MLLPFTGVNENYLIVVDSVLNILYKKEIIQEQKNRIPTARRWGYLRENV